MEDSGVVWEPDSVPAAVYMNVMWYSMVVSRLEPYPWPTWEGCAGTGIGIVLKVVVVLIYAQGETRDGRQEQDVRESVRQVTKRNAGAMTAICTGQTQVEYPRDGREY